MQSLAKETMEYCSSIICAGMSLVDLRGQLERFMMQKVDSFWYWGIGAFVFAGKDTTISISGREYQTADYCLKNDDIITIDLSPQIDGYWGDYARTIILESGAVKYDADTIADAEWQDGIAFQRELHKYLCDIAGPDMTFADLYYILNKKIETGCFINLDFKKNLGHSIEKGKERIYIDKYNEAKLSSVPFFTFEPHISRAGGTCGFKQEDVYYFEQGRVTAL